MENELEKLANDWISAAPDEVDVKSGYYCGTRDVFQPRLDKMLREFIEKNQDKFDPYIISAIVGEIGNNSFDHNIGNWRDIPGIFFGYVISGSSLIIAMADRGQGILKTLRKAKPELADDKEALTVAFTERISGRAPESRGNGLKFVKESVKSSRIHLTFISGKAKAELNEELIIGESESAVDGCLAIIKL